MDDKIATMGGPCSWLSVPVKELERVVEVRTVRVTLECPICHEGRMEFTGSSWPVSPPGYHHKCTKCGDIEAISGHRYPEIRYLETW